MPKHSKPSSIACYTHVLEIFDDDFGEIVKEYGCTSFHHADRLEEAIWLKLGHERFDTRIVEIRDSLYGVPAR